MSSGRVSRHWRYCSSCVLYAYSKLYSIPVNVLSKQDKPVDSTSSVPDDRSRETGTVMWEGGNPAINP